MPARFNFLSFSNDVYRARQNDALSRPVIRRHKFSHRGGFTLFELMMATILFSITAFALLGSLVQAHRLSVEVRYRNHARFILGSIAGQFLRAKIILADGTTRGLFVPTGVTRTGTQMGWDPAMQVFSYIANVDMPNAATAAAVGMPVELGDQNVTPILGHVFRTVQLVNPADGTTVGATQTSAGYLLRGDFVIEFPFRGRTLSQSMSVVRMGPQL